MTPNTTQGSYNGQTFVQLMTTGSKTPFADAWQDEALRADHIMETGPRHGEEEQALLQRVLNEDGQAPEWVAEGFMEDGFEALPEPRPEPTPPPLTDREVLTAELEKTQRNLRQQLAIINTHIEDKLNQGLEAGEEARIHAELSQQLKTVEASLASLEANLEI